GMIDDSRPDLMIGRIGAMTADYLLTTQRSPVVPQPWLGLRDRYRAVLSTSDAVVDSLRAAGFTSFRAPLGIDPDHFNPWGSVAEQPATLCRSVDFRRIAAAEGSSLPRLESLACGTPVVCDAACATVATLYRDATGGVATLHGDAADPRPTDGIAATADGLLV